MRSIALGVSAVLLVVAALWAAPARDSKQSAPIIESVNKGAKWLASVQGADGGWGQDGGETSYIRRGERLETNGNDVANTAVAALALRRAGKEYQPNVERAVAFILRNVEQSPTQGLAVTGVSGTQIQRKLGPYIDTFLTSMLLAEIDGTMRDPALNSRVRKALEKTVAKIQSNQQGDGSWNNAGGWAPILGTSMASRSLFAAKGKGVAVDAAVMARADRYTKDAIKGGAQAAGGAGGGIGAGKGGFVSRPVGSATAAAAGVPLYQSAQALEQLSRTEKDRRENAPQIAAIQAQMASADFVAGYGSMGGEEFFSYLNISDGMKRTGGKEWDKWHGEITEKILKLQNADGTWSGHHCITGRVAVTSAAILNLTID